MKILVALSGGIDSSVMAHLLAREGHELIGVRFLLWTDPLAPSLAQVLPSKCCNAQTAARAKHVADSLGIPYHILDLQKEFKSDVVDPFLEDYKAGLTPNPCIGCNRSIKFGKLLSLAEELGCDKLATGHYARVAKETLSDGSSRMLLLEAIDPQKDQSYYLYGLSQEQLSRVLFPLGGMHKQEIFELGKQFDIPYEDTTYRESQDLCFFPEKTPEEFFKRYIPMEPGEIVRRNGEVVGTHKGLPLYTIGQRKGLNIGGLSIPLEVVAKDPEHNRIVVNEKGKETCDTISLTDMQFVSWKPEENSSIPFEARTRCHAQRIEGTLRFSGALGSFTLRIPQPLPAAGQSLVLYRGEEVVGGGVIA